MVTGLDKFREAFLKYADNYVIIGGTACDIVLRDTDMKPRATSDIDMIVIVENMTPEFAAALPFQLPRCLVRSRNPSCGSL